MTDRRAFVSGLGALLVAPRAVEAQDAGKRWRIGYLGPSAATGGLMASFEQGLRELGYVEGTNVAIERRYTDAAGNIDEKRLNELAAQLVRSKPDVLVVSITEAALAAKRATTTLPIVMVNVGDPIGSGLVASLARPGGNVTGLSRIIPDLIGKNLELLREIVPQAEHIAVLTNPADPLHPELLTNVRRIAGPLGVRLRTVEASTARDLESAFSIMVRERAQAVLVLPTGMFYINRAKIADAALQARLPAMFAQSEMPNAGGLIAYSPSSFENYRRAALFVDKILKGARPADLPVEQPTKFELIINLKTAKALGLTIPPSLLLRADQVIE